MRIYLEQSCIDSVGFEQEEKCLQLKITLHV